MDGARRSNRPSGGGGSGRGPRPVSALLPRVLDEVGLSATARAVKLLEVWEDALGPELAPWCRLDGVRNGVLYALVPDSAWMQRLQLEKPRILERLERALGEPAAEEMRLRLG